MCRTISISGQVFWFCLLQTDYLLFNKLEELVSRYGGTQNNYLSGWGSTLSSVLGVTFAQIIGWILWALFLGLAPLSLALVYLFRSLRSTSSGRILRVLGEERDFLWLAMWLPLVFSGRGGGDQMFCLLFSCSKAVVCSSRQATWLRWVSSLKRKLVG